MNPDTILRHVIDTVSAVFMVVGALMSLGRRRRPAALSRTCMSRMHAATKPQVLGLFLLLARWDCSCAPGGSWPVLLVAWLFQLLTVPVSAHMVGRAGYRTKHLHPELLSVDELDAVVEAAAEEEPEAEITAGDVTAGDAVAGDAAAETAVAEPGPARGRRRGERGWSGQEGPGLYRDTQGLAAPAGAGPQPRPRQRPPHVPR